MVVLQVIEEGREPDVPGPGVDDDTAGGETSYASGRVGSGEHDDRRPILGARSDVRSKAALSSARDQILRERRGHSADGRDADFVDVIEASQLLTPPRAPAYRAR